MKLALFLSAVVAVGCGRSTAPAADSAAQNASKANKEMTELLRKADALAGNTNAAVSNAGVAAVPAAPEPAKSVASAADAQKPAPARSKTDVMRDQAAATFGDRLGTLRRTAEAARLKKGRYVQVCQGKVSAPTDCPTLTADISDASKAIERELGDIEEAGRRAGIDPGLMRDLLAKYGF